MCDYERTLSHYTTVQCESLTMALQESSAKLTNQRVNGAFTSSPFSIDHARHILSISKFQHSYFTFSISVNSMCENCKCEYTVH